MRKILILFFFVSIIFSLPGLVLAQENLNTPTPTPPFTEIPYNLPYPGILPDNPLYFLKALRDNLIGFFISDPVKKAEYDLLMADKRLVSSNSLIDKKNYDLANTTLSKAGNYFDEALQQAVQAKSQGGDFKPLVAKLIVAAKKHQEVIYQMEQKTKGQIRYELEFLQVRAKSFQETAQVIQSN